MLESDNNISIFLSSKITNSKNRIWLSSGISYNRTLLNLDGVTYEHGSFVPREPWQVPSESEISSSLFSSTNLEHGFWKPERSIGIFPIPNEVLAPLRIFLKATNIKTFLTRKQSANLEYCKALSIIKSHLTNAGISEEEIQDLGINVSPINLITTTRNYGNTLLGAPYIGLHIDSWDNLNLKDRAKSRNRICINLELEDRFLIFLDKTIFGILTELKLPHEEIKNIHPKTIIKIFMRKYPEHRIIKLRIAPCEAYSNPKSFVKTQTHRYA